MCLVDKGTVSCIFLLCHFSDRPTSAPPGPATVTTAPRGDQGRAGVDGTEVTRGEYAQKSVE